MKKFRYILTGLLPFIVFFGLTGLGKLLKFYISGDDSIPDVVEGIFGIIVLALVLALVGLVLWGCYNIAGVITDGLEYRLNEYRSRRRTQAQETADEDQQYRQRIGVEE